VIQPHTEEGRHNLPLTTGDVHYVSVPEIWIHLVRIRAKSCDEAIKRVQAGEGTWGKFAYDRRLKNQMVVERVITI